ncbi:hypothetical protein VTL71DRAFT_6626 [Oculimacula yallundae]|uniref:Uncharacterized protein n=1 Tax=Oculimacula yallundae TaxID=86028 RepID=A0ABR4BXM3_9HELO
MTCYCANYYSSKNCHNNVTKFGDRCALCLSYNLNPIRAEEIKNGVWKANQRWVEDAKGEQLRKEEEKGRRNRVAMR